MLMGDMKQIGVITGGWNRENQFDSALNIRSWSRTMGEEFFSMWTKHLPDGTLVDCLPNYGDKEVLFFE